MFRSLYRLISLLVVFLIIGQLLISPSSGVKVGTTVDFEFTTTAGQVISLSEVIEESGNKTVVVDWAASWCPICEENQKTMKSIRNSYSQNVTFLSVSYGESGDSLDDVAEMKSGGSYPWLFGLDHENVAKDFEVANGYVWVVHPNTELKYQWEYTIVSGAEIRAALDDVIAQPFTEPPPQPNSPSQNNDPDEFELLGGGLLFENPIFWGFLGFATVLIVIVIMQKYRS